jgi:hypothetical protein
MAESRRVSHIKTVHSGTELQRFQITFDDGSTTHEWVPTRDVTRTTEAPLLLAGERERAAAARDGRRPRFAIKAERIREILGG